LQVAHASEGQRLRQFEDLGEPAALPPARPRS